MSKKENLYTITHEFKEIEDLLIKKGGEISEAEEQRLDELTAMIEVKVDSSVGYMNHLEDTIERMKIRIQEFSDFKKARENELVRFKEYVLGCLEHSEKDKFSGDIYELKIKKPLKIVHIEDENTVPIEFLKEKKEFKIDKKALKDALKNDEINVAGISLIDGKKSISVKIRK